MVSSKTIHHPSWYSPTFSNEHGVYVVFIVSFLIGVAAANYWNLETTIALVASFAGFQAEHPLVLQIKQRRSLKPRFLIWGGIYAFIALMGAFYLAFCFPLIVWIYALVVLAFVVDAIAVYYRKQKSVWNELLTFAAVCLVTPFAYSATKGNFSPEIWGLWLLNTLFFASAIFTVKLRKPKTTSLQPALIYHGVATLIIVTLWYLGLLNLLSAVAFGVVLIKFALIISFLNWYQTTKIKNVAILETLSAMTFLGVVIISVLPAHLPIIN